MTNDQLMQYFKDEDLMEDRREYSVECLMDAYEIDRNQATELFNMIQGAK